jgi:3-deoxy-manno-octulosonate cytidylyltransferase (CMP-KDO synthetase)
MIEHVYRRAAAAPSVHAVFVATDDERIVRAVESFGGIARLTRPTHKSGTDRVAEIAESLSCDVVVNLQGDEPLIEPAMIEELLEALAEDPSIPMATLRRRITDPADFGNQNVVKVVTDTRGYALYFSRAPIPCHRDTAGVEKAAEPPAPFKHVGIYAYRRVFLMELASLQPTPLERSESLEQLRVLEHGYRIKTVETSFDSIGVDTPEDLERIRLLGATLAGRCYP